MIFEHEFYLNKCQLNNKDDFIKNYKRSKT